MQPSIASWRAMRARFFCKKRLTFGTERLSRPVGMASPGVHAPCILSAVMAFGILGTCMAAQAQSNLGQLVESGHVQVVKITPELVAKVGSRQQPAVPPELLAYRPESYRISPGDTILVTVWDHPELSGGSGQGAQDAVTNGRLVHPDGTFYYPFVGTLKVAGMRI